MDTQEYSGTFREDQNMATALVLVPVGFFALLQLCTHKFFSDGLITCGHESFRIAHDHDQSCEMRTCDQYGMAEHDFTIAYCFTRMSHYNVDLTTGELGKAISLQRYKIFPYIVFSFSLFGIFAHFIWAGTNAARKQQV